MRKIILSGLMPMRFGLRAVDMSGSGTARSDSAPGLKNLILSWWQMVLPV